MRTPLLVLALVGGSNQLKNPGQCPVPAASGAPVVTHVPLVSAPRIVWAIAF